MSLPPQEQFRKFLETSKEVLILIPENPSADAVGSAWALYYFLEKLSILPAIAFSNHLSEKFSFLPRPENILSEISGARDFVLSFNTAENKIIKVRHEEKDDVFNILVTPEKGSVNPKDFSFILAKFKYDLVIVIDCSDLEKLGKLYLENTDLFFEVPIVNIDYKSDNDNFGQINLTDITASSSCEILARTFEETFPDLVDKKIATCLLAGLIGATDSFQKKNTTPKALLASANLMNKGADQQEIIRWMYKTQPLHILKLWGRAMAKINWDTQSKLVWSALNVEDFVQSRSKTEDLPLILSKLEENYSEGQIFMAVYNDTPQSSVALLKFSNPETAKKVTDEFPQDFQRGILEINFKTSDILEIGQLIAEKIKILLTK
ncbi:MAG: DHH family phosphoesterase [Parcubacteria group bacterium]|jgi:phosphoesterase RecJ-like protein